jgi:hypothetical protein
MSLFVESFRCRLCFLLAHLTVPTMAAVVVLQNNGRSINPVFKTKETLLYSTTSPMHLTTDPASPKMDAAALSLRKKQKPSQLSPPSTPRSVADTESTSGDSCFTRPCKKRVRFFVNEKDQPITASREGDVAEELTLQDRERLWYSSADFKYFRQYSKKLATIAAQSNYGLEFAKVYKICGSTTVQDLTHCSRIANSAARGLEVATLEVLMKDRKAAIRGVLNAQAKIPVDMPDDKREKIICATAKILSRQARLLARVLGNGDAAIARALCRPTTAEI